MGGIVEPDEAGEPADVRLFRVVAVRAAPTGLPGVIKEFGGTDRRCRA